MPTGVPSTSERIRPATLADAAACAAIYAPHVRTGTGTFETEPPDPAEMAARLQRCLERGWPWLMLEAGAAQIGYAYLAQFRDRAAYRHTGETSIYLEPDLAGAGRGRRLLAALLEAGNAAGFRKYVAVIGDSGNAASIGLHASLGFRHVGTFEGIGLKFGRALDVVLMQRN